MKVRLSDMDIQCILKELCLQMENNETFLHPYIYGNAGNFFIAWYARAK